MPQATDFRTDRSVGTEQLDWVRLNVVCLSYKMIYRHLPWEGITLTEPHENVMEFQ
jgi:hypothetical protein